MSRRSIRPASARAVPRLAMSGVCCTLLLAIAAGCGSENDDAGTATDAPSSEASPSQTPTASESPTSDGDGGGTSGSSTGAGGELVVGETVEPGQAAIVSASNVDGETTTRASALVNGKALNTFLASMEPRLATDVRAAVAATRVPADSTLFGAVVSVGCDRPTAISWTKTFEGIEVTPTLPKSGVQCLVPVTSVALFLVPD